MALGYGLVLFRTARTVTTTPYDPATLAGLQTVNGVTTVDGDAVLVQSQTDNTTNDLYIVNANGAWARAQVGIDTGALVLITEGTFAFKVFMCIQRVDTTVGVVTPTVALTFSQVVDLSAIATSISSAVASGSSSVSGIASASDVAQLIFDMRILRRRVEQLEELAGVPDVNPIMALQSASPIGDTHAQYP